LDRTVVAEVPPGGNWRDLPDDFPSQRIRQIREGAARGEGSRSTYYGRLQWDRPSYTISTYITRPGNGCFIHPTEPRLLTVREAARLQTFPDSWRFVGTIRQRAMQVGNAVPPLLGAHIGSMFTPGTVADLFSGAGGLSLGMSLAGHKVVAAIDHDPAAIESHNRSLDPNAGWTADLHPDLDLRSVWAEVRRRGGGAPELLVGGPPCQGFSTAGKALADDPRNRLLWAFVSAVDELKPKYVVMENVIALAQARGREALASVRTALLKLGYASEVRVLHAEAYGVPQRRRRTIVIASRDPLPDWPTPRYSTVAPSFDNLQPGPHAAELGFTVADAISDLPGTEGGSLDATVQVGTPRSALQSWLRGRDVGRARGAA
jgi:DNA (cytosine-5)-methyltransferase 1